MAYSVSRLNDERILLLIIDQDYDLVEDMVASSQEVIAHLDQAAEPMILITDARAVQIKDVNALLMGAQSIRQPEVRASVSHPNLLKYFSVIDSRVVNAAMKGLNTATFGFFHPTLFESVEAAVEHARATLAEHNG